MTSWKSAGALILTVGLLSAQQVSTEDPVIRAQNQRAQSGEGDLPPVPRGVLEPPPLPPPTLHVKDTKGWRASRKVRKSGGKVTKGSRRTVPVPVKKRPKKKS